MSAPPHAPPSPFRWETRKREFLGDLETPVSAFLKLTGCGARFLLESVDRGAVLGRYSFLGLDPLLEIECHPDRSCARTADGLSFDVATGSDPTALLAAILRHMAGAGDNSPGNLLGGAVGYLGYEYVRNLENVPADHDPEGPLLGRFVVPGTLLTFDHIRRRLVLRCLRPSTTHTTHAPDDPVERMAIAALEHVQRTHGGSSAEDGLDAVVEALSAPPPQHVERARHPFSPVAEPEPREFESRVRQAKEYIAAGDIFQVVLSQRLTGSLSVPPFQLYRALRMHNPSPYLFFLDFDETALIGSSPEVLVKLEGRMATVRPIAGTRPRGSDSRHDRELADELLADEKERAEHVMLVDLGRNDLGRVCEPGTVEVTDFMTLERYSRVMHIVSWVQGKLREGLDRFDLLRATFPAGTVSGAPKIRAMELIHQFEDRPRGPYAGALGYFGAGGDLDLCITIRTMVCHRGKLQLQAGAGVVADSDPHMEHLECRRKMQALIDAIEFAERGLEP